MDECHKCRLGNNHLAAGSHAAWWGGGERKESHSDARRIELLNQQPGWHSHRRGWNALRYAWLDTWCGDLRHQQHQSWRLNERWDNLYQRAKSNRPQHLAIHTVEPSVEDWGNPWPWSEVFRRIRSGDKNYSQKATQRPHWHFCDQQCWSAP